MIIGIQCPYHNMYLVSVLTLSVQGNISVDIVVAIHVCIQIFVVVLHFSISLIWLQGHAFL